MNQIKIFSLFLVTSSYLYGCFLFGPSSLKFEPLVLNSAYVQKKYHQRVEIKESETPIFRVDQTAGELPPGLKIQWSESDEFFDIVGVLGKLERIPSKSRLIVTELISQGSLIRFI